MAVSLKMDIEDVLKIAEQIERNGSAFYQMASERFHGEEKKRLISLAVMERVHEQLFSAIRREVTYPPGKAKYTGTEPTQSFFISAVSKGIIFNLESNPADLLSGKESLAEILQVAIGLEKDSVIFYMSIKDMFAEHKDKHVIGRVIKEEMGHISILSQALLEIDE